MNRCINRLTTVASLAFVAMGLAVAGCESSGDKTAAGTSQGHHDMSTMSSSQSSNEAVTCDKCKMTWVKSPVTNDKGRVIAYTTKQSHECPDCRAAAQNFFATGKLEHACKTCGEDAMQKCEAHVR